MEGITTTEIVIGVAIVLVIVGLFVAMSGMLKRGGRSNRTGGGGPYSGTGGGGSHDTKI